MANYNAIVTISDMYLAYEKWSKRNKVVPIGTKAFSRKLIEEMPGISKTFKRIEGKQTRVWMGAEIIDEELKPEKPVQQEPEEPIQSQVDQRGNRKLEVFDADYYFPGSKQ